MTLNTTVDCCCYTPRPDANRRATPLQGRVFLTHILSFKTRLLKSHLKKGDGVHPLRMHARGLLFPVFIYYSKPSNLLQSDKLGTTRIEVLATVYVFE